MSIQGHLESLDIVNRQIAVIARLETQLAAIRALLNLPPDGDVTEAVKRLQTALVEGFDVAIPQAMPWTGTFGEKASYAANVLPEHLRGLARLYKLRLQERDDLQELLRKSADVLASIPGYSFDSLQHEIATALGPPLPPAPASAKERKG